MESPASDLNASYSPGAVCSECKIQINSYRLTGPEESIIYGVEHRRNLRRIQLSALQGCHLCSILAQHLFPTHSAEDVVQPTDERHIHMKLAFKDYQGFNIELKLDGLIPPGGRESKRSKSGLIISTSPPATQKGFQRIPGPAAWSRYTSSDAMLQLAESWIKECASSHPNCQTVPYKTDNLPEYLIEVTPPASPGSPPSARLVLTSNLPSTLQWITLSHCWGAHPIFCTKRSNLPSLLSSIPLAQLPKTFQHAIDLTHRLNQQYIWIDSLCIIQDDSAHWLQESAIMGNVYGSSLFTIAASCAADGSSGCFSTRNPLGFHVFEFQPDSLRDDRGGDPEEAEEGKLWVHGSDPKHDINWTSTGTSNTLKTASLEPLHRRAWVVQERCLSPRTIFFGTRVLGFECFSATGSDLSDALAMDRVITRSQKRNFLNILMRPPSGDVKDEIALLPGELYPVHWMNFLHAYWSLVEGYTACALTRGTDKLVAIDGMVRAMEKATGFSNVAGLWKEAFLYDLLWYTPVPGKGRPKWRAPTWSWAAVDGAVEREPSRIDGWKAKVVEIGVEGRKGNGMIEGAWVKIWGLVRKVKVKVDGTGRCSVVWKDGVGRRGSDTFQMDFLMEGVERREFWLLFLLHDQSEGSQEWWEWGLVIEMKKKIGNGDGSMEEWIRVGRLVHHVDGEEGSESAFAEGVIEKEIYLI